MIPRFSILAAVLLALGLPVARGEEKAGMDVESYLRRLDIVYQQPAARSVDYMPLGNGQLGLLVDPLGSQTLGGYVMKSDVWDYRHARPDPLSGKVSVQRYRELRAAGKDDEMKQLCDAEPKDYSRPAPRMLGQVRCALEVDGAVPTEPVGTGRLSAAARAIGGRWSTPATLGAGWPQRPRALWQRTAT